MADKLSERLEALAALRRAAPLHCEAATEAAWLEEAAELARRVERAEVAHVEPKNGLAVMHERCLPLAMIGQRVRLVPEPPEVG